MILNTGVFICIHLTLEGSLPDKENWALKEVQAHKRKNSRMNLLISRDEDTDF